MDLILSTCSFRTMECLSKLLQRKQKTNTAGTKTAGTTEIPKDKQILVYDGTTNTWKYQERESIANKPISKETLRNKQILRYNNGEWEFINDGLLDGYRITSIDPIDDNFLILQIFQIIVEKYWVMNCKINPVILKRVII